MVRDDYEFGPTTPLLLYLWLRSWNSEPSWRRLKLRPRYPGAPHDSSFLWLRPRCIVSLTLDPKPPVMYTHTCTHHTLVFDFTLDIQRLCILGSGIPHKSNLLVFGFALDTRTPCTLFSGFTHKSHQPPIIRHSALAIDTCMGPSGTLGNGIRPCPV